MRTGPTSDTDPSVRIERFREHVEQDATALEKLEQTAVRGHLVVADVVEEPGGAAHEQPLLVERDELRERRAQALDEIALGRGQAGIVEPPPQALGAEL